MRRSTSPARTLPALSCFLNAYRELKLIDYGVEFAKQEELLHVAQFHDGETMPMWSDPQRTAEEIARFSTRDSRAYLQMLEDLLSIIPALGDWEDTPIGYGPSLAEICAKRPDGATWMRRMRQSGLETVDEYFRNPHIRAWAAHWNMPGANPLTILVQA